MTTALSRLADKKYLEFNKRLISSSYPMLGVRIPDIRATAKELLKARKADGVLSKPPVWHEEVILHGLIMAQRLDANEAFFRILPFFDNWASCDTVVLSLKGIKRTREKFLSRAQGLYCGSTFERRALIVALLGFYLCDGFIDRAIELTLRADNGEYYVSMAAAWLLATAMINYPEKVIPLISNGRIREETARRTIQKALDSYRITPELKERLRLLRGLIAVGRSRLKAGEKKEDEGGRQ